MPSAIPFNKQHSLWSKWHRFASCDAAARRGGAAARHEPCRPPWANRRPQLTWQPACRLRRMPPSPLFSHLLLLMPSSVARLQLAAIEASRGLERSGTSFNSPEPLILKTLLFVGAVLYCLQLVVNLIKHLTGHGVERSTEPTGD